MRQQQLSFFVWLVVVYLATSSASNYIFHNTSESFVKVVHIAIIALALCALNFFLGAVIGGKRYKKEASQSLGQKNTMFMTWVALAFLTPQAAIGPVFYLVYQNLYNSYLLAAKDCRSRFCKVLLPTPTRVRPQSSPSSNAGFG